MDEVDLVKSQHQPDSRHQNRIPRTRNQTTIRNPGNNTKPESREPGIENPESETRKGQRFSWMKSTWSNPNTTLNQIHHARIKSQREKKTTPWMESTWSNSNTNPESREPETKNPETRKGSQPQTQIPSTWNQEPKTQKPKRAALLVYQDVLVNHEPKVNPSPRTLGSNPRTRCPKPRTQHPDPET